jgi:dihydroxy-acid dehydratase
LLQDGDIIEIDIPAEVLRMDLSEDELARRRAEWQPRSSDRLTGWLARYAKMATSASKGAVLEC